MLRAAIWRVLSAAIWALLRPNSALTGRAAITAVLSAPTSLVCKPAMADEDSASIWLLFSAATWALVSAVTWSLLKAATC